MHPAYSVILFTTATGAGYGLLALLGLTAIVHGRAGNQGFAIAALAVSFVFVTVGLLASTFHLGRPERAWRAFSQWRSSWLSREGIASLVTYGPALAFALAWLGLLPRIDALLVPLAALTMVMCLVTVVCTGKIYSSLPTIRQWHSPLVVPAYVAIALATGAATMLFLGSVFSVNAPALGRITAVLLAAAAAVKWHYWRRIDAEPRTHTIEAATGLGSLGAVRQWEAPHTGMNFVMKEMGYSVARRHAAKLRSYVLAGFLFAGAAALAGALAGPALAVVLTSVAAALSLMAALVERWLFFAEAQHVSTLYYGAPAA